MKLTHLVFLLLPVHLLAQTADDRSNSIGLFGETNSMFSNSNSASMSTSGLQYHKKRGKHSSYSFTAGYGNYNHSPNSETVLISGDTAKGRSISDNINLGILGFGIETERQFYKKLYFFAGLELRAGYGSGTVDSTSTNEYNALQNNPGGPPFETVVSQPYNTRSGTESLFYMGFTPYFGLKLEFKKFSIGTSFMNYVHYEAISTKGGGSYGSLNFDSNNITQQVFVRYKL